MISGCWLDQTWCASPNCKNECGRKLPEDWKNKIPLNCRMAYAYFCTEPSKNETTQLEGDAILK